MTQLLPRLSYGTDEMRIAGCGLSVGQASRLSPSSCQRLAQQLPALAYRTVEEAMPLKRVI